MEKFKPSRDEKVLFKEQVTLPERTSDKEIMGVEIPGSCLTAELILTTENLAMNIKTSKKAFGKADIEVEVYPAAELNIEADGLQARVNGKTLVEFKSEGDAKKFKKALGKIK